MKRSLFTLFLIMVLFLVHGQADTIELEDVTISVSPFENRLSSSTGSLSILSNLDEPALYLSNPSSVINTIPGVFMASGTQTTNRLTIRGIGSRTPYNTNRIKAYLDDIPLTNGDGVSSIEDVDLSWISRFEVLKGPASALHGSGLGGVILLKSSVPVETGFHGRITTTGSSFNTWKSNAMLEWKSGATSLLAGYGRASSDGFRENNQFMRNQFFISARTGGKKHTLSLIMLGTGLYAEIPSSLNENDFMNAPESAAGNWLAINGHEKYSRVLGGATLQSIISSEWTNKLVVFSSWQDPYESRPFNILDDQGFSIGLREMMIYRGKNLKLNVGFELFREAYNWSIISTDGTTLLLENSETRRYGNVFTHARWELLPILVMEGALNMNLIDYRISTLFDADGADQSGSYGYPLVISPRWGMNLEWSDNQFLHISAGHGFSAPSLEETLLPEGLVNTELKPETGWNMDAGMRGWLFGGRWYYDVTVYNIFVKNMLVTKRISEDTFTGINAGAVRLSGLEISSKYRLGRGGSGNWYHHLLVDFFLNSHRFSDFIDDDQDHTGNHLPGIPEYSGHISWRSTFQEILSVDASVRFVGRQFMNDGNTARYAPYELGNLKASYLLDPDSWPFSIRIFGGVNNIWDSHYASMILVNAPSFGGAAPRYYYPGMPRNYFLGLSFSY